MIFAVPFTFFASIGYLRYKETITLAERGLLRPTEEKNGKRTYLSQYCKGALNALQTSTELKRAHCKIR